MYLRSSRQHGEGAADTKFRKYKRQNTPRDKKQLSRSPWAMTSSDPPERRGSYTGQKSQVNTTEESTEERDKKKKTDLKMQKREAEGNQMYGTYQPPSSPRDPSSKGGSGTGGPQGGTSVSQVDGIGDDRVAHETRYILSPESQGVLEEAEVLIQGVQKERGSK